MPRPPRRLVARLLACALVMGLAGALGRAMPPTAGAAPPTVGGAQVFPADNIWNRPVGDLPVHPNSAAYLTTIGLGTGLKADFGSGLWQSKLIGIPYTVVPGTQPKVAIHYTAYGSESDPGPMPIPPDAPVEGSNGQGAGSGDRHVLVIDRDNGVLYELFGASKNADNSWNAASGAKWSLNSNALRPDGWTSADAAGLPIFPGLARYDEVAGGVIAHALRFTVQNSQDAHLWPARHDASASTDPARPPMGLRVRLKASVDISGYQPQARVILQCLKDYGMIVADNGSNLFISGAPDERWNNDILRSLGNIMGSDLEAVDTAGAQVAANSAQARQPLASTYALRVATQGSGAVSPGGGSYAAGARVRLVATPASGWYLRRWRVDGREIGANGPLLLTMSRDRDVVAVFARGTPPGAGSGNQALTVATEGSGSVTPGSGSYEGGLTVLLDATPNPGWTFAGWASGGRIVGYAPSFAVTMDGPRGVTARFAPLPTYSDVSAGDPARSAIGELGGAGIIRGYGDGRFGPGDHTLRAQMAALIARAMGWDAESWGTPFVDRGGINDDLWRNVGTLAHYGVAYGYGDGRFGPNDELTQLQAVSFITRAFVARGWWAAQPNDPALYPSIPASSGHRADLVTFVHYAGAIPGTASTATPWPAANTPCTRAWFALTLHAAIESYWGGVP